MAYVREGGGAIQGVLGVLGIRAKGTKKEKLWGMT